VKLHTKVWMRCESKGRPAETITMNAPIRECIMKIADWLSKVYMGSHINIRIARTEAELSTSQSTDISTLSSELDMMLGELGGTPESSESTGCDICGGLNTSCPEGCQR
jgi:hypothetical protein